VVAFLIGIGFGLLIPLVLLRMPEVRPAPPVERGRVRPAGAALGNLRPVRGRDRHHRRLTAGAVFVFGVLIRRNGHFQTEYGAPAEGRGALRDKDYAILRGLRVTTSP